MIILMTGLPGTGKTHLARALAQALPATLLNRDEIRDAIFPPADLDYSAEQNELASQITYQVAEYILQRHPTRTVILDGRPFSKRAQIAAVAALAQRTRQSLKVIYCWALEQMVAERLAQDLATTGNIAADRTMTKYHRIQAEFEPLTVEHLAVDTSQPTDEIVGRVMAYVNGGNHTG